MFLQALKAIDNLMFIGDEQRIAALHGDADLDTGKAARPAEDNAMDGAGHSAMLEHQHGNGREAAIRHDARKFTAF